MKKEVTMATINLHKIILETIRKSDTAYINKFSEGECEQLAGEINEAIINANKGG